MPQWLAWRASRLDPPEPRDSTATLNGQPFPKCKAHARRKVSAGAGLRGAGNAAAPHRGGQIAQSRVHSVTLAWGQTLRAVVDMQGAAKEGPSRHTRGAHGTARRGARQHDSGSARGYARPLADTRHRLAVASLGPGARGRSRFAPKDMVSAARSTQRTQNTPKRAVPAALFPLPGREGGGGGGSEGLSRWGYLPW